MSTQLVYANPNIWCRPGWCLQYVREAFGIYPGVQPTATAGWNASPTKHRDRDFPAGKWVPVWFHLANVPAGHVALMAPNGNVYSTSDDNNTPHCHPDLDDLINYYNRYGQPITYLGWTEDIEGVAVVDSGDASIGPAGEIIEPTEEDDMPSAQDVAKALLNEPAYDGGKSVSAVLKGLFEHDFVGGASMPEGKPLKDLVQDSFTAVRTQLATIGGKLTTAPGGDVQADAEAIAKALAPDLAKALLVELSKGGA